MGNQKDAQWPLLWHTAFKGPVHLYQWGKARLRFSDAVKQTKQTTNSNKNLHWGNWSLCWIASLMYNTSVQVFHLLVKMPNRIPMSCHWTCCTMCMWIITEIQNKTYVANTRRYGHGVNALCENRCECSHWNQKNGNLKMLQTIRNKMEHNFFWHPCVF